TLGERAARPPGHAHSQSLLRRLCRGSGGGELRAGLSAGDRGDRLSSRSRRTLRGAARAHGCFLPRLACQPPGRGRRPRLSRARGRARPAVRFPRVQRRVLFRDLHPARARGHARSGGSRFCQRGRVPVAIQALEPAGAAHRLCRRRPSIPRALLGAAQRLGAASADAGAARGHRRLWRRGACRRKSPALRAKIRSRRPDYRRPLRLPAARRRILSVAGRLGAGRRRSGGAAAVARGGAARRTGPVSRARPSRRLESGARLYPRRHGAGPGHNGTGAPPPGRGAGLRDVMAAIDRGLDSFLSDAMRDALRRRLRELGGLTLIALATLVALAPWSVQDPSPSHATNAHVRNILGVSGAIVADLLTQLFGLAALAFILPIAIWGWRLVTHRPMQRERVRLLFWLLGVLLTAG